MATTGDDCYFYYYSTCTKGKDCTFRHCELALGSEVTCTSWKQGICTRSNCKFRHMEIHINRSQIPCYWENQPNGCRKPHCAFLHKKSKANLPASSPKLILPVSDGTTSQPQAEVEPDTSNNTHISTENSPNPSIEPVVVTFDEESDTESAVGTPAKLLPKKILPRSKNLIKISELVTDNNLGIKTLEQIRIDKIHRESMHYYELNDNNENNDKLEDEYKSDSFSKYAKQNIQSSAKRNLVDVVLNVRDNMSDDKLISSDLRDIIIKKREEQTNSPPLSKKRVISLKSSGITTDDPSITITVGKVKSIIDQKSKENYVNQELCKQSKGPSLDFKIKTLEEIRKEKNLKKTETNDEQSECDQAPISSLRSAIQRPKVKRPPMEIYQVKAKGGLSPRKNSTSSDQEVLTKMITSPSKRPLSRIEKVNNSDKSKRRKLVRSKIVSEHDNLSPPPSNDIDTVARKSPKLELAPATNGTADDDSQINSTNHVEKCDIPSNDDMPPMETVKVSHNSGTDDLDKLLLSEDLSFEDMDTISTEKTDDILLEIDKILES